MTEEFMQYLKIREQIKTQSMQRTQAYEPEQQLSREQRAKSFFDMHQYSKIDCQMK